MKDQTRGLINLSPLLYRNTSSLLKRFIGRLFLKISTSNPYNTIHQQNISLMKKRLVLFLAAALMSVAALAQNVSISGVVTDSSGEPVIGASIIIPGTTTGTATDENGQFSLEVPRGTLLEVSSIGYIAQSFRVGDQTVYNISLDDDTEMIESTVVVGYGTTKRENFTGSVQTVKVSEGPVSTLAKTNAMDMLRGMTTGMTISQSGVAGSSPSMQVRGQKSISGGSQPLIVLDGVIFKGSINDIDPNTIESMSVMKDATSLAAYGSQAANGVIMITSKKGERGKPTINFRASVALSGQNYKPDLRDGYEYIELINAREGRPLDNIEWLSALERANYDKGKQTDWVKYVSRLGVQQEYSMNISGATDQVNYMLGGSFSDNKNFIKGNHFIRETFTGRVNTTVTKHISAGVNFSYSETKNDGTRPNYTDTRSTPWGEPTLSDGIRMRKFVDGKEQATLNPLWNTYNGVDSQNRSNSATLGGNIDVTIPWVKGLSYRVTGNYTRRNTVTRSFTHEYNLIDDLFLDEEAYTTAYTDTKLNQANGSISNNQSVSWVLDNILTYTRDIGSHYINVSLVYTRDYSKSEGTTQTGSDFSGIGNTTLGFYGLTNAAVQKTTSITYNLHTDIGYLGRVNYSFKNKYHINASVRRDGSSVFGAEHKWGIFPAVGAAWTMTDEPFMKGTKGWLDYFKLKLSWGKNGNQSLSPYGTLSRMAMGKSGGYAYILDGVTYFGQTMSTLGNPDLGWETTTSWNGGFEADLFNRVIHWEVDMYKSKTTDQIFSRTIPVMGSGITSQSATMGQVNNWGIESILRAQIFKKRDFSWNTQLTFTRNRNKLIHLYGGEDEEDDIPNGLFLGKSLGAIYGYKWIGIVQKGDTAYMEMTGSGPGDAMFEDYNKDGKITADDRHILGYNKEAFRMSWSNTITWKNLTFYMMFNASFSSKMYGKQANNLAYLSYESMQYTNMFDHPFWTEDNPSDKYPKAFYNDSKFTALQSYGFVRLQDAQISYNLRGNWLRKAGIGSVQAFVSGRNLFFIAPHWEFSDPEVRNGRSQQLARTFTFGINVRF